MKQPLLTLEEVARILTERGEPITAAGVHWAEEAAFEKLRRSLRKEAIDLGIVSDDEFETPAGNLTR